MSLLLLFVLGFCDFLVFLWFLIMCAEDFSPFVFGICRERPLTRCRSPRFREYYGIFNGDLVDEVILRRPADALNHTLLITRKPPGLRFARYQIPQSRVDSGRFNDQRISVPTERARSGLANCIQPHKSAGVDHSEIRDAIAAK